MYLPDDSDDNSNSPSSSVSEDKKINRPSIGADTTRLVTVETLLNEVIQDEVKDKGTILQEDTYSPSQSNDTGDKTENWNENEDSFGILNISKSKINHMDIFNSSSSEDDEDEEPELIPNNNNLLYANPLINYNSSSEISSLSLNRETKNEEGMETKFSEETSCVGNSLFSNSHNNNAEFESDSKFENNTLNNDFNDNVESKAGVKLELDEPCQPVEPSELRNFPELGSDNNLSIDLTISDDEDDEIQLNSPSLYNSERENRFMRVSSGRSRELSSYHLNASYKDYTTFGEIDEIDEKSQLSFISGMSAFESADSLDGVSKQSNPISIKVKKNSNNSSNPFHVFPEYDIFQKETNREENKKIVPITKGYREIDINRAICLSKIQIGFHSMFTLLQKRLSEHIGSRKQIHDYFTLVFQYLKIYDSKAKNKKFAIIVLKCISILNMKDGTKSREFSMNPIFSLTERHFEFGLLEYDDYSDLLIDNTYFDIIVENLQIGIKSLFCILNFFELGTDLVSSVDFKLAVAKFKKAIPIFFIAVYHTFHRISLKLIYILNSTLETDFRFSKKRKKIRNLENKLEVERKKFEELNISKRYVELNQIEFINKRLPFISANCLPTDNLFFNQKKLLKVQPDFADVACNVICACLPPFISYREWRIMCSYILIDYARKAIEIDSKDPRSVEKQAQEKLADLHLRTGSGTVLKRKFLKTNSSEISGSLDILPDSEGILKKVGLRSISESIDDIIHCLKQKKSCCVEFGVKVAIINVTVTLLNCLGVTTVSSSNQLSLIPKFSSSINTQIFDPIPLHNEVIRNEKVLEKFIKFTIPFIKELNLENSFEKEYEDMSSLISPESFNTDILIKYLMLCKFWITTGLDKKIEVYLESENYTIPKILKRESSFLQKYLKSNMLTAEYSRPYAQAFKLSDCSNINLKFHYIKYEMLVHYFLTFTFHVPEKLKNGEIPFRLSIFKIQLKNLSASFNSIVATSCILQMMRMKLAEKFYNTNVEDEFYKEIFTLTAKYFEKEMDVSEITSLFFKKLNDLKEKLNIEKDSKSFDNQSYSEILAACLGIKSSKRPYCNLLRETTKNMLIKIIMAERYQYGKFFTEKLETYRSYLAFKKMGTEDEVAIEAFSKMRNLKRQLIVDEDIYKNLVEAFYEVCNLSYSIHPFDGIKGKILTMFII